jgi:tryptophan synthase alpha subunit
LRPGFFGNPAGGFRSAIQAANQVALEQGLTPDDDFALCAELTGRIGVPALVMTYYNLAWHYLGTERLDDFAAAAH